VAAVGLVFALLIWSSSQRRDGRAWWLRLALPVTLAASVGALVWITGFAARDVAIDRLGGAEDDLRWPVWQSVIEMLPQYMPWGTGVGSYAQAYQILEPDELLRPTISNHAHNEFLEVAFTAGIPGLVLLGLAAAALLFSLWRTFSSSFGQDPAAIYSRLGAGMIVLLAIASATDYPTRTPILAAVLALAAVWASLGGQAADTHKSHQGPK
jgi:O-antigen ligase